MLAKVFLTYLSLKKTLSYSDSYGEFEDPNTECIKSAQSPIDISNLATCHNNNTFPHEIVLNMNVYRNEMEFIIENDGYSLDASPFVFDTDNPNAIRSINVIHSNKESIFRFKNGLYSTTPYSQHKEFCFDSIHFHWGSNNTYGSEHTMNGKSTPLEAHFVSFSCDYSDIREALNAYISGNYQDKYVLGVVGVLFEIGEPNKALDSLLNPQIITRVRDYNNKKKSNYVSYNFAKFNVTDLIPKNKEVVLYRGSLTTPPCYELVRWHVMRNKLTVSESQLLQFRRMMRKTNISSNDNYRPVTPLNDRTVYNCEHQLIAHSVPQPSSNLFKNNKKMNKSTIHLIIGIAGASIALIVLVVGLYFCHKRMNNGKSKKKQPKNDNENPENGQTNTEINNNKRISRSSRPNSISNKERVADHEDKADDEI